MRPRKGHNVNLYINDEVHEVLKTLANQYGVGKGQIVEAGLKALAEHIRLRKQDALKPECEDGVFTHMKPGKSGLRALERRIREETKNGKRTDLN